MSDAGVWVKLESASAAGAIHTERCGSSGGYRSAHVILLFFAIIHARTLTHQNSVINFIEAGEAAFAASMFALLITWVQSTGEISALSTCVRLSGVDASRRQIGTDSTNNNGEKNGRSFSTNTFTP